MLKGFIYRHELANREHMLDHGQLGPTPAVALTSRRPSTHDGAPRRTFSKGGSYAVFTSSHIRLFDMPLDSRQMHWVSVKLTDACEILHLHPCLQVWDLWVAA